MSTTRTATIAPALDDVLTVMADQDTPYEVKGGPAGRVVVQFVGGYCARLSEDDSTVTVTFSEGWGILGETRFSHAAPAQAFLVAAHIASLGDVAEVLAA